MLLSDDRYSELFAVTPLSEKSKTFLLSSCPVLLKAPLEGIVTNSGIQIHDQKFSVDEVFVGKFRGFFVVGCLRTTKVSLKLASSWKKIDLGK